MAQANIKAVITAEDRASSALKGFGNAVDNINNKIVTGAKRAATALGLAAVAATAFSIKSAADFEQTRIGLENMLGSADKARVLLQKISKFAADTPFEFPELAQATRQLVAFGFSADEAYDTMKQLGNVSAAVGAPINDLAYLMGTLRAQGRAFTIDIRQFAMRGIPIYEYLAKVLKVNTNQLAELIEEGKVGFPEVQKAFQLLAGAGGKWGDTMARQSKSLSGLFSTLKDVLGQTGRELVGITQEGDIKAGSAFDLLRQAVGSLILNLPTLIAQLKDIVKNIIPQLKQWASNIAEVARQVGEYLGPQLEALWNTITTKLIPALTNFWQKVIVPMIPVIGTALVLALGAVIAALNIILTIATPLINFLSQHTELVWALVGAYVGLKIALAITGLVNFVTAAIVTLGSGMGAATLSTLGLKSALTQMALPGGALALFASAAIAVVAVVLREFEKVHDAWNGLARAEASAAGSHQQVMGRLQALATEARARGDFAKADEIAGQMRGISARASGGPVMGGSPYIVGEKGPELFVPNKSGTIVPNNKMGGSANMVVNIGMYAGTEMEKRKIAESLMRAWNDLQASRGIA